MTEIFVRTALVGDIFFGISENKVETTIFNFCVPIDIICRYGELYGVSLAVFLVCHLGAICQVECLLNVVDGSRDSGPCRRDAQKNCAHGSGDGGIFADAGESVTRSAGLSLFGKLCPEIVFVILGHGHIVHGSFV